MSSLAFQVTPLRPSDYESWRDLFRASRVHFNDPPIPEEQYLKSFARLLDPSSDLDGFVLRQDPDGKSNDESDDESGSLLGLIHFTTRSNSHTERKAMFITDLWVDPGVRNKGFAKELGKAVLEESKRRGCSQLDWAMHHGNPIKSFYDRVGTCARVLYRIPLGEF